MSNIISKFKNSTPDYISEEKYYKGFGNGTHEEADSSNDMLNGINKSDLHLFIDKNSSRYVDIYAKNENKKYFINWNWAAFFFGANWLSFRKMYKNAAIYLLISNLLSACIIIIALSAYKDQLVNSYFYNDISNDIDLDYTNTYTVTYEEEPTSTDKILSNISRNVILWTILIILGTRIFLALFADCIYRNHILKQINSSLTGRSYLAFFACSFIDAGINDTVMVPLITMIIRQIYLL